MSDRLTRKEMKSRDRFQVAMTSGLEWVQDHRKELIAGAAALVLLVVGLVVWSFWASSREAAAQEALAEAIEVYGAPTGNTAGEDESPGFPSAEARRARARELFDGVRDRYGSTDAGAIAAVYLGKLAVVEGDSERARELWSGFLDAQDDTALAAEVRLNLFDLDRAAGRGEQVATELEGMLARRGRSLPTDVILYQLATTLEMLDREEEAEERYRQIVEEHQTSPYAGVARQKTGGGAQRPPQSFQMPS